MHKKTKILMAIGAASAGLLTASGVASADSSRRAAADAPACAISDLQANTYDATLNAAGNHGLMLTLTNASARACTVNGYPVLHMEDAAHNVLPTNERNGSTYFNDDVGPSAVELSPGERASDVLAWGSPPGGNDVEPSYLRIYLPGSGGTRFLRIPFQPGNVYDGRLTVTALAAHTQLRG